MPTQPFVWRYAQRKRMPEAVARAHPAEQDCLINVTQARERMRVILSGMDTQVQVGRRGR
jgi:hypothetical protein